MFSTVKIVTIFENQNYWLSLFGSSALFGLLIENIFNCFASNIEKTHFIRAHPLIWNISFCFFYFSNIDAKYNRFHLIHKQSACLLS